MHVHQSLFKGDENMFFDGVDPHRISKTAKSFIAGQLKHIAGISAITSPLVNSYKRLTPGYEAPVYISWATVNRSALIRVPAYQKEKPKSARIELRCPDPSCNIYLAFATMLTAGLDGIKNNLVPADPVEEDLYDFDNAKLDKFGIKQLPASLHEALMEFSKSEIAKETLGSYAHKKYLEAKLAEWDEYRLYVSHWETEKYAELY
jgi:glutamine synthetase